jgi:hypothetical protein
MEPLLRGRFRDLVNVHQASSPLSVFSSCASIALKSSKSTIDLNALSSALSVDTAEEADWTGDGSTAAAKLHKSDFGRRGEDRAGGRDGSMI